MLDRLVKRRERYSTASGGQYNDTVFAYDSRDNVILETDARGYDTTYGYDGLSRPVTSIREVVIGGATVTTATAYDANSRVIGRTDPNGNTTVYTYDPFDCPAQVIYADGTVTQMQYSRFGDMVLRTEPSGSTFTCSYDKLGRMMGRTISAANGYTATGTETFTYDALSRMTSAQDGDSIATFAYDSLGNVWQETLKIGSGAVRTVSHVFDDNGNRKKTVYPGGRTLTFTHDNVERVSSIVDATGAPSTLASYAYVGGRVARRTYPANGTQLDYTYNGVGSANAAGDFGVKRPSAMAHTVTSGGAVLDSRSFKWDQDRNKLERADTRSGGPQLSYGYAYDGLSRLTSADPSNASATTFTYDPAGNRTNAGYALEGSDLFRNTYSSTPFDRRAYDQHWNLTAINAGLGRFTFDVHNRLTGVIERGTRVEDDLSSGIPAVYITPALNGSWTTTNEALHETSADTGRILREFDTDATEFSFSYRSPHDPDDDTDYDPERYGLAILRLAEPVDNPDPQPDTGYRYAALIIEPKGLFVREWQDDQLLGELASYNVDSEANTWYDVKVAYSGTNDRTITVSHAKQGEPLKQAMNVQITLPEAEGQKVGFGTGELGEYEFRDILFKMPSSTADTILAVNQYDALGRRIARTLDPAGMPQVTEYYYDSGRVVEKRDRLCNVVADRR